MATIYRVLSPLELEDIPRINGFRTIVTSMEVKQFCTSEEDARRFADHLRILQDEPLQIISIEIDESILDEFETDIEIDNEIFINGIVVTVQRNQMELLNGSFRNLTVVQ